MLNLSLVLDAAGSSFDNIVKINIYLTNLKDFAEVNDAYTAFFPGVKPVSTIPPGSKQTVSQTLTIVTTGKDLCWSCRATSGY